MTTLENLKQEIEIAYSNIEENLKPSKPYEFDSYCSFDIQFRNDVSAKIAGMARTKDIVKFSKKFIEFIYVNYSRIPRYIFDELIGEAGWVNAKFLKNFKEATEKFASILPFIKAVDAFITLKVKLENEKREQEALKIEQQCHADKEYVKTHSTATISDFEGEKELITCTNPNSEYERPIRVIPELSLEINFKNVNKKGFTPKSIHIALDKIPEECKELLTAYLEKCYDKFWSISEK